jgi:hypothetical protein
MAAMRAWIGTRTGEPGRARARLAASSRRAAASSAAVSAVTSCSRISGDPGAVVLLGDHPAEGGLHVGPDRGDGVLALLLFEGVRSGTRRRRGPATSPQAAGESG